MRLISSIAALLMMQLAAPAFSAEPLGQREAGASAQTLSAIAATGAEHQTAYDEYTIGPYDLLEISVFQVAEMSRAVRVNAKGVVTLPLIGPVRAGGLTAVQLEEAIASRLAKDYLQNPQVSVFIKEFVSQRVTVEGSVVKAGIYPLSGRTTLIQAIAMASGLGPLADESQVKVFRTRPDGGKNMAVYDMEAIRAGKAVDPVIEGNDVIVVDESGAKATVKGVTDTLRGFFNFGMF